VQTPDLPDNPAEAKWTILEAEWAGHARSRGRIGPALLRLLLPAVILLAFFTFAVVWPLSRVLSVDAEFRTGLDWMHLSLQALSVCYLGRGLFRQSIDAIPQALRWRRRGPEIWGLRARICPDCLAPFDARGAATCRHRYSASMQPGIMRLLEAQATDDARREREARIALAGRSRAPRFMVAAMHLALTVVAFWIVAGPNLFSMLGFVLLGTHIAITVQRASRIERCTVACTACGHLIHDIAQQPVCPECAADLSAPAAVRSTAETNEAAMWNRRAAGVALLLGFSVAAPYLIRAIPTPALTGLVSLSLGRVSSIERELDRRQLTPAEQSAATDALIRHQLASAQSGHILSECAKQTVAAGGLGQSTLDAIGESLHARWTIGGRPAGDGREPIVVPAAAGEQVELSVRTSRDLAFIAHPVVFIGPISLRRLDAADGGEPDAIVLSAECIERANRVTLPALEPGRYEIAGECTVACVPYASPVAFAADGPRAADDLPASLQRARRRIAATLVVR